MPGPDGHPIEKIRVPALATAKRSMNIGSGTFALPAPEEWTGATLVEIDAPDAITNRSVIGYYASGGCSRRIEEATTMDLGSDDVTSIEITLPASPDELGES